LLNCCEPYMYEHKTDNMSDDKKQQAKRIANENGMFVHP
jgi:hypothetical protein